MPSFKPSNSEKVSFNQSKHFPTNRSSGVYQVYNIQVRNLIRVPTGTGRPIPTHTNSGVEITFEEHPQLYLPEEFHHISFKAVDLLALTIEATPTTGTTSTTTNIHIHANKCKIITAPDAQWLRVHKHLPPNLCNKSKTTPIL